VLTEMLGMKPGEIQALFKQTLEADRAREGLAAAGARRLSAVDNSLCRNGN
jgi:hypothetical protein